MSTLPPERLGQLRVAKLRALVRDRLPTDNAEGAPFGDGASLRCPDGRAAVLVDGATRRSLGPALVWAVRRGASSLLLIVDADPDVAGHLAREAGWFDLDLTVERIDGTTTTPVEPATAVPAVAGSVAQIWRERARSARQNGQDTDAADGPLGEAIDLLHSAGLEIVVEHGVTKGEVLGLEVARVVDAPDGSGPAVEVGVGRFDREISTMMFANIPTPEALAKAVDMVRTYRRPGAEVHPLRDLVPERWLRTMVLADPSLVGAAELAPVDTTVEPQSLREAQPAASAGVDPSGRPVVVVCTAGVDLDVVPLAADTRAAVDPAAELVICGPARNLLDATRQVAAALSRPARFVELELPY